MFIIACTLNHANIPVISSRLKSSGARSIILVNRAKNIAYAAITIDTPKKPNFSAKIANIESLAASGKYPYAWTLLASPSPNKPPEPTAISA